MKKALLIMSLLAVGMVVGVPQATAQEDQITVTVTVPTLLSVSLSPDAWAIGNVALGDTVDTGTDYFTATNTGNVTEDFSIVSSGSVMPGPVAGWTCGATAGSEIFEMKAKGGDFGTTWTSIHNSQTLETGVVKTTGTVSFDLQFKAPTDTTHVDTQHTITVTVTASAST